VVVVVVAAKAPRRGGGGCRSKTTKREREMRERLVRIAREGKRYCARKEEEEAVAKGKSETEGTRGAKSFCALK